MTRATTLVQTLVGKRNGNEMTGARVRVRVKVSVVVIAVAMLSGCGGGSSTPTSPSPTLAVQSVQVQPSGIGVQYQTSFQFDAAGGFPAGTQFLWNFGDGATATSAQPQASHAYESTGTFTVTLQATSGSNSSVGSARVTVGSLVGQWQGTVTGHTRVPRFRPIPITAFDLRVSSVLRSSFSASSYTLRGTWSDDAGCRETDPLMIVTPGPNRTVRFSLESFECNGELGDTDMVYSGTANETFTVVEGTCTGGPNCRFQMTRR